LTETAQVTNMGTNLTRCFGPALFHAH